jgi:hypothetical protein
MNDFDCRATAAVLQSGNSLALAGHVATAICIFSTGNTRIKACAVLLWCAIVYLAVRVKIDVRFFELLADHPTEELDAWLEATGLRKNTPPRTIQQRTQGALRLWRVLMVAVVAEIALMVIALLMP